MDVVVFKPLGGSWAVKVKDWKIANQFARIDKKDIAPILKESINAIDYAGFLKKGFERCGLFPFIVDNINFSRLVPVTTSITEDQLLEDDDAVEPDEIETKEDANNRLQMLEELIESSYLDLFRTTKEEWNGPIEYTALYSIWKKLNAAAAIFNSNNDRESIPIDIETLDCAENEQDNNTQIFIVGENGELFESGGASCIVIENSEIIMNESATYGVGDMVEFGSSLVKDQVIGDADSEGVRVLTNNQEKLQIQHPIDAEILPPRQEIITAIRDESNDLSTPTQTAEQQKKISLSKDEPFDREALKRSFPMPLMNVSKKRKMIQKEKQSTVITSEAWKEIEKKKLEDKERVEEGKVARKAERENKKVLSIQLKAEKALIKEQKKRKELRRKLKIN